VLETVEGWEVHKPNLHVFFIHGLFGSDKTWERMLDLLKEDRDLATQLETHVFEYSSPKFSLNPMRRVPTIDTLAKELGSFIETQVSPKDKSFLLLTVRVA
jgi:hypothetical protein